jgi:nucleoid DNA-binding protein
MRLLPSITPHRHPAKIGDGALLQKLAIDSVATWSTTGTKQAFKEYRIQKVAFLCFIWPPAESQGTITKIDMAKLTKRDIVVSISNQTGMVQHQVFDVVQKTLDKITDSLANNIPVELRNFGVFLPRLTRPRIGRNPNQPGSSFVIPPRATVKFKAGKVMRQRVEKLSRQLKEAEERKSKTAVGVQAGE